MITLNKNNEVDSSKSAFYLLICVFFFWGFVAASNDILIPIFKKALNLKQWQSQLISVTFYVAYTVGSIAYLLYEKFSNDDFLSKIGYKKGLILGLGISAFGTLLFYPAAQSGSFNLLLLGLFIVGLGFSLQQTAANPLVINIGDKLRSSQRLSMAGGVNNIGTTIGPILVSYAIFNQIGAATNINLENVKIPYLVLGASFVLVAFLIHFSKIPNFLNSSTEIKEFKAIPNIESQKKSALQYPQLVLGMIAIFIYVGVEVSNGANLSEYLKQYCGLNEKEITPFISLYWGSLMIGRWASSASVFTENKIYSALLKWIMPYLAFALFLLVNLIAGYDIDQFYFYAVIIVVLVLADIISKGDPSKQLMLYSGLGVLFLTIGMAMPGIKGAMAFVSVGLFCSTLWPCIFTLAIQGLGKFTNQGSSYLIMMIMGGGIVSFIQSYLSENHLLGINLSYLVGVLCFLYLLFYGWKTGKISKNSQL
mgnify:CR=1 FL=1